MLLDVQESQLVLVDYQTRLMPAMLDAAGTTANALRLAQIARWLHVPTCVTEQYPQGLGETVPELKAVLLESGAKFITKTQFSGVHQGLADWLAPRPKAPQGNARSLPKHLQKPVTEESLRASVVLAGCETHVCLLQTALELLEAEFEVWVVTDACSSRTERNRDAAFDRLAGAGVELVTTEMVAFEWLRHAQHPQFKAIQGLIK